MIEWPPPPIFEMELQHNKNEKSKFNKQKYVTDIKVVTKTNNPINYCETHWPTHYPSEHTYKV